jgi:hypothetical protein
MKIYIARRNIDNFRRQIAEERDPKKLDLLLRLLAEEEVKLAYLLADPDNPSPATPARALDKR